MRITATLKNNRNGQTTAVRLRPPFINAGMWIMSERARRAAFNRIGADWQDTNSGVTASHTIRAVDDTGYHSYTIWTGE